MPNRITRLRELEDVVSVDGTQIETITVGSQKSPGVPPDTALKSDVGRLFRVGLSTADVGLDVVDKTSDATIPVSAATQTGMRAKYDSSNPAAPSLHSWLPPPRPFGRSSASRVSSPSDHRVVASFFRSNLEALPACACGSCLEMVLLHKRSSDDLSRELQGHPPRPEALRQGACGRFCMDKDELGRRGEEIAAAHLRAHGFEILDRNWRVREGELDIVAREGVALVVVEVKTRSSTRFGLPVEAITRAKAQRLRRLAYAWAHEHHQQSRHLRIDAVGIIAPEGVPTQVRHLRAVA